MYPCWFGKTQLLKLHVEEVSSNYRLRLLENSKAPIHITECVMHPSFRMYFIPTGNNEKGRMLTASFDTL
jgi:hypothetical protein